jgi:hypothetical protein
MAERNAVRESMKWALQKYEFPLNTARLAFDI